MVKGILFIECDGDFKIAIGNNSEIVKWGDGNYYKRFIIGSEKKLKNKVEKLENEIELGDDNDEVHVRCGLVLRHNGSEENVIYLVKGILFTQCDGDFNIAIGNNSEIVKWGDGKYYKRVVLGNKRNWKIKLKSWKIKLKSIEKIIFKEIVKSVFGFLNIYIH